MSKAALREQRRSQRIARRNRQRAMIGAIIVLLILIIIFFVYRDYQNRLQAAATPTPTPTSTGQLYDIGILDTTLPTPSPKGTLTASGLIYEDLRVGDGATAKAGDTVSVNYTGWLGDGTKFDSSIDRGQPFEFKLGAGSVIAGWDEGVVGMKVNGTRLLIIPPSLGYGSSGRGSIPPDATLTFEVQLVSIK